MEIATKAAAVARKGVRWWAPFGGSEEVGLYWLSGDPMAETVPVPEASLMDWLRGVLDAVPYAAVMLDAQGRVMYVNGAGQRMVGRGWEEMCGRDAEEAMPEVFGRAFGGVRRESGLGVAAQFEEYYGPQELWTEVSVRPVPGAGVLVCARDVTARKAAERIALAQLQVLEMMACGAPLDDVLRAITVMVEQQSRGDVCSILRLDSDGVHLRGAACGSLPAEYCKAIDGAAIGPAAGSCGTAAYTRSVVVVSDIATDPRWEAYRDLALPHGLLACWSQPILSCDGARVLGTVANYSYRIREPAERSLRLLETASRLAQIAIERVETS